MSPVVNVTVVGAGILGLAHAYQLARRGMRVLVLERRPRAEGASVRNFGMLWPIGQPAGPMYNLARRSREHWLTVLHASGLWHDCVGSLHLAYHEDEAQILREFADDPRHHDRQCEVLSPGQAAERCRWLRTEGLRAALWSPWEVCVDPRQVIAELPAWLNRTYGVEFAFGTAVLGCDPPMVRTSAGIRETTCLVVCTGDDFQILYPEVYAASGLVRCKLQMMRSAPLGPEQRLGPMLAAGLTLRHYKSFAQCPTLPALERRLAAELPDHVRHGIHVMASQNGQGELVLGDSHEYGAAIDPFDKAEIDELILQYLQTFLAVPGLRIASRWHGTYGKHPTEAYLIARPVPSGVIVVTAVGGAGMTLSFGLADQVARALCWEEPDDD